MCWVKDEVNLVHLGESRLNERMEKILRNLGDQTISSILQVMGS